jgi:hypothetical protein
MVENASRDPTFSQVLERLHTTPVGLFFIPNSDFTIKITEDPDMVEVYRRKSVPEIRTTPSGLQIPLHNNRRVATFLRDGSYERFRASLTEGIIADGALIRPSGQPRWVFAVQLPSSDIITVQAIRRLESKKSGRFNPEDLMGVLSLGLL